jgi:hypothetical protein
VQTDRVPSATHLPLIQSPLTEQASPIAPEPQRPDAFDVAPRQRSGGVQSFAP